MGAVGGLPPGSVGETELPGAVAAGFSAAIEAALRFLGNTAPNPPVGCAILDADGHVLATGAHERAGLAHAEAAALASLRVSGAWARAHTLVVTLEPCNHQGRTGPCTEAILQSPVRAVWIGCADPNPHVAGHGAARLAAAGLSVRTLRTGGPIAQDCAALIAPFRRLMTEGRPWITIKQALDETGSMRPPPGRSTFTSDASLLLAHRLRRATEAIVTGTGTVLADLPGFDVRRLPDHPRCRRVLAVVGQRALPEDWLARARDRFDLHLVPSPDALPTLLGGLGVMWAMVEAGPSLLDAIEQRGLWDDRLVIRRTGRAGADETSVETRDGSAAGGVSPLRLLPELVPAMRRQEDACFPES